MENLKTALAAKLNDVRAWWERLSLREKRMVGGVGGAVLAFSLLLLMVSFASSAAGYRRRTQDKLRKLAEVQELAQSYREAQSRRQAVEGQLQASNVRLLTYVEEKATQVGLGAPNMTPKGEVPVGDGSILASSLDVTFTDVDLRKLVGFLEAVEQGPGVVKVTRLRVEPRPATDTLAAWATVSTYRMKQQ